MMGAGAVGNEMAHIASNSISGWICVTLRAQVATCQTSITRPSPFSDPVPTPDRPAGLMEGKKIASSPYPTSYLLNVGRGAVLPRKPTLLRTYLTYAQLPCPPCLYKYNQGWGPRRGFRNARCRKGDPSQSGRPWGLGRSTMEVRHDNPFLILPYGAQVHAGG